MHFNEIPESNTWSKVAIIDKGWSDDKKYYIETTTGRKLLLRISDIGKYESKKKDYETIKQLDDFNILISRPIDFGVCNNGKHVYILFTWIEGEDAEKIIPTLSIKNQYRLGFEAGKMLSKIHEIPAPDNSIPWEERFNKKIDRNLKVYKECEIKYEGANNIINYIDENRYLLKNRPQSFQHGDYHVGNMIVTNQGKIGIIDFNRLDYGDAWEEFNRITWCADASKLFASGLINGYFNDEVPEDFFKLMALYIGSNQLSSIPWAIPFGETEIKTMLKQAKDVLEWYNDFQTYVPKWYISNIDNL